MTNRHHISNVSKLPFPAARDLKMVVLIDAWTDDLCVSWTTRLRAIEVHDSAFTSCMFNVWWVKYGIPWGLKMLCITDLICVIERLCSSRADTIVPFRVSSYLTVYTEALQTSTHVIIMLRRVKYYYISHLQTQDVPNNDSTDLGSQLWNTPNVSKRWKGNGDNWDEDGAMEMCAPQRNLATNVYYTRAIDA